MGASHDGGDLPIGLTMGDPAGIGPEIALKAWLARDARSLPPFVVYADAAMLSARAKAQGLTVPVQIIGAACETATHFVRVLPVMSVPLSAPVVPGRADASHAPAILQSIEMAVGAAKGNQIRAVVTNPIAKSVLYAAGFAHPGHTEYLGALADRYWARTDHQPVMMLASEALRVVPLTIHVALKRVPNLVTRRLIMDTVRITWAALREDFGIQVPRIAVAGLNPHAGEDGALGDEDRDTILPAIRELQAEGLNITGPHAADTLFHEAARQRYDAAIAMYHDQALIPIKTLSFDTGVNVTLGLPFVRTSPDHGTAFDIAAEGRASPQSLIEAIKLAGVMATRRAKQPT